MPIRKEKFFPGGIFHIFNRGNWKQDIFYNDGDRYRFLQAMLLANNSKSFLSVEQLERSKNGYTLTDIKTILAENKIIFDPLVKIYTDCLMFNHYHFLLEELKAGGISLFMKKLGIGYAKYFTTKYKRPGSLFQGRFKSVQVKTDGQLMHLLAYINIINPAQLIEPGLKEEGIKNFEKVWKFADGYNWSTHQELMGRRDSILINKNEILEKTFSSIEKYANFVKDVLYGKRNRIWSSIDGLCLE